MSITNDMFGVQYFGVYIWSHVGQERSIKILIELAVGAIRIILYMMYHSL